MINRRALIGSGLALPLLARASAAAPRSSREPRTGVTVACFVVDARSEEGCMAAHAAAMRGSALRAIGADITSIYAELDSAWQRSAFAVAGVTTSNALFALERLAADRGLRTVYRGVHVGQSLAEWTPRANPAPVPPLPAQLIDGKTLVAWLLAPRPRGA